jgi:hypothetical protein
MELSITFEHGSFIPQLCLEGKVCQQMCAFLLHLRRREVRRISIFYFEPCERDVSTHCRLGGDNLSFSCKSSCLQVNSFGLANKVSIARHMRVHLGCDLELESSFTRHKLRHGSNRVRALSAIVMPVLSLVCNQDQDMRSYASGLVGAQEPNELSKTSKLNAALRGFLAKRGVCLRRLGFENLS